MNWISRPASRATVFLLVPWSGDQPAITAETANSVLAQTAETWRGLVNRVKLALPDSSRGIANALRSTVAYMMINRDGPALQPGARSYRRSWIRDGAMISAALLRLGHPEPAREFMDWYAPHQYESGKVPCCVDARGSDPVPEHDSHGELIYLVAEYYRSTGDLSTLRRLWPHVERAVAYMDSLRRSLRTDALRQVDSLRFYGLMPPSISHEGYSAKPVHSYWDDFFTARGFTDAADLSEVLGEADSGRYRAISEEFRHDLLGSLRTTIAQAGSITSPAPPISPTTTPRQPVSASAPEPCSTSSPGTWWRPPSIDISARSWPAVTPPGGRRTRRTNSGT
jgi:hypothetical protein